MRSGAAGSLLAVTLLAACGGGTTTPVPAPAGPLPRGARPVGPGPRFHPPLRPRPVPACRPGLGPREGVHLELFARGLVVLFPAGIGTRPPREVVAGRIAGAACFGPLVTIDPTGLVLLAPGTRATVGDVFAAWGRPLAPRRTLGFAGPLRAWVNGRRRHRNPAAIVLRRHDEVVLEVGRYVPPHRRYEFPPPY